MAGNLSPVHSLLQSHRPLQDGSGSIGATSTTIPQFGDSFLDRIIGLSDHASDTAYRQQLNDLRLDYQKQAIDLEVELRTVERNLGLLDQQLGESQGDPREIVAEALRALESGIPELVEALQNHIQITGRLYQALNQQTVYGSGVLYRLVSEKPLKAGGGVLQLPEKGKLIYVLALVLTSFVVVPVVMIRNSLREKREQKISES